MSHEFQSGVFLHGQPAWHGLGHVLDKTLPARQAFRLAEADFPVAAEPIFTAGGEQIEGFNAIVRKDTDAPLAVMTTRYRPIQNEQLILLAEALREHIEMDAVCVLDAGRKVTFTGKIIGNNAGVNKRDEIVQYLVGVTSHDGSVAFSVMFSPVRVVCANTLSSALNLAEHTTRSGRKRRINRIRHTANAQQLISKLPEIMDFAAREFTHTVEELEAMAKTPCLAEQFRDYCTHLFAPELATPINDVRGDDSTQRPRQLEDIPAYNEIRLKFNGAAIGGDMPHMRGTVYAAYQAVAEYYSHDAGRNPDPVENARQRLESLWFGPAAKRLEQARELATAATRS